MTDWVVFVIVVVFGKKPVVENILLEGALELPECYLGRIYHVSRS